MAIQHITHFTIYVPDQDECLSWYQDKLGFVMCADDSHISGRGRWLTIAPAANKFTQFILAQANNPNEQRRIGDNAMCVLNSDNCYSDCELFDIRGVEFLHAPEVVPWGITATFRDLYGNPYTLVELTS